MTDAATAGSNLGAVPQLRHEDQGLLLELNPRRHRGPRPAAVDAQLPPAAAAQAHAVLRAWPGYAATPLRELPGAARALGVRSVHCKDEAARFGLGSFKALGGAYAVYRIAAAAARDALAETEVFAAHGTSPPDLPGPAELVAARPPAVARLTFACATAGNHGRSVAWGAAMFGASCVVYMHAGVPAAAERAIAALGARVVRVPGGYDASVTRLAEDAAAAGWVVVADTAWSGFEDVPRDIKLGYTLSPHEAAAQLLDAGVGAPTHVVVQAGVGGMAAAAIAALWPAGPGAAPPHVLVVEPDGAACCLASCVAGRAVALDSGAVSSVMTGLACGTPSPIAWPVLDVGADAFAAIPDAAAAEAQRALAAGELGPALSAGPSGAAGVAALMLLAKDRRARDALGLDSQSRILVFLTEAGTSSNGEAGARTQNDLP